MKVRSLLSVFAFGLLALFAGRALAQLVDEEAMKAWGKGVSQDVILGLVANQTWHIDWRACMGASDCSTYWDFSDNGKVCARGIGATPTDQCADDGTWKIEQNSLCWELSWLGGGDGYKSTCVLIKETGEGKFQATRAKGIGLPFFDFTLSNKG